MDAASIARVTTISLSFRIDRAGRPLSVSRPASSPSGLDPVTLLAGGDLEPSLAVSAFLPADLAREDCRLIYTAEVTPFGKATPAQFVRAATDPATGLVSEQIAQQLARSGDTCPTLPAIPRVAYFPPYDTMKFAPGRISYAALRYDVDAAGLPVNLASIDTNDAGLAAEAVRALTQSRFAPQLRLGCLALYARPVLDSLMPPPMPDLASLRSKTATCPLSVTPLLELGQTPFPEQFRRRSVFGWGIVRFDIAPWGKVGNATVVQAEPAAGFGEQALRVVQAAKARASAAGYSGCLARVYFKIDSTRPPGVRAGP